MSDRKETPQDLMDQLLAGKSRVRDTELQKPVNTEIQNSAIKELKKPGLMEKYNIRVTVDLSADEMDFLDSIRRRRIAGGSKRSEVDNSKLIREAIKLLS